VKQIRAVGYVRMSGQAGANAALRHARTKICSCVRDHSLVLLEIACESPLAPTTVLSARPELLRVLGLAEEHTVSAMIVMSTEDISTDPMLRELVLTRLEHVGCQVFVLEPCEEDPRLETVRHVVGRFMSASDEYERALRSHRLQAARRAKSEAGGYSGGRPPYGMQVRHGELVDDQAEKQTIDLMVELRNAGSSFRSICEVLANLSIPARSGRSWQPMTVRRIVERATQTPAAVDPIAPIQELAARGGSASVSRDASASHRAS
jgi:DNA invertase Pin-like site-specific DNA recombinase